MILQMTEGHKAHNLSDRYNYIDTNTVVENLVSNGYYMTQAISTKPRSKDPRTVKHFVRMRHNYDASVNTKDVFPEIVIVNSHDGTSSLRLLSGLFRMVCSNGLVTGSIDNSISITHRNDRWLEASAEAAYITICRARESARRTELFKAKMLHSLDQYSFADRVSREIYDGQISAQALLQTRRPEDEEKNLWNTFNKVQENIMRGGLSTVDANNKIRRTRAVRGANSNIAINTKLWDIAEEYLV